jgi:TFIIF-interacting CTD phosphatase-like protein
MKKEEIKGPVENKPTSISTYNGDKCDDYNWSQGVGDVTIQFTLKEKINKKNVESRYDSKSFKNRNKRNG